MSGIPKPPPSGVPPQKPKPTTTTAKKGTGAATTAKTSTGAKTGIPAPKRVTNSPRPIATSPTNTNNTKPPSPPPTTPKTPNSLEPQNSQNTAKQPESTKKLTNKTTQKSNLKVTANGRSSGKLKKDDLKPENDDLIKKTEEEEQEDLSSGAEESEPKRNASFDKKHSLSLLKPSEEVENEQTNPAEFDKQDNEESSYDIDRMVQLETAFKEHQTAMKEYIFTITKQWQLERAKLLSEITNLQQQYQPKGLTDNSKLDTRILQNVQNIRDNSQANRELLEKAVKNMVEFCAKTREKEQDLDPATFHILTGIVRELSYSQQHIQGQLNAFTDLIAQLENELEKRKKRYRK